MATLVSGQYAGAVSRLTAYAIDAAAASLAFLVVVAVADYALALVSTAQSADLKGSPAWTAVYLFWLFLYFWVSWSIAGQTPGKTLVGLRIVTREGDPVGAGAAFVRVVTFPLSFVFGVGFALMLVDRERRALHDMLARTAVVYDWGERPAKLPAPLTRYLERKGAAFGLGGAEATATSTGRQRE